MAKVNLDNRVKHLVGLSAKHIFKISKPRETREKYNN